MIQRSSLQSFIKVVITIYFCSDKLHDLKYIPQI